LWLEPTPDVTMQKRGLQAEAQDAA